MVFDRPKKPGSSPSPQENPAFQRPQTNPSQTNPSKPKKVISVGGDGTRGRGNGGNGGGRNGGNGDGRNGGNNQPSPWLQHSVYAAQGEPSRDKTASFVEYLRWMRSPDDKYKVPTKVKILQLAEENANYRERLQELNERTRMIAGAEHCFEVKASWRIRVGGHRGPESILLPAFDALGMPYIASSTLRGAARNQAIRQFMQEGMDWKSAVANIAPYFGALDAEEGDRSGKVIFLDAYPCGDSNLMVDMANNIWNWKGDELDYSPNPNPFLSLREPTFLIGLRKMPGCSDETFEQVRQWLIAGLQAGIGSQINTGYGELIRAGQSQRQEPFFKLEFTLQGQLIHGRQKFTQWNWNDGRNEWQMRGKPDAEVRPGAFKSMLRYWFRAFALGVLPADEVRRWEANLFGSITPQTRGWVTFRIENGRVDQPEAKGKDDPCGEQSGVLQLSDSPELPEKKLAIVHDLFQVLVWLMFHLGGLGQGARRPCYSRKTRQYAPWWRGSMLIAESDASYWELPETAADFQRLAQERLQDFYEALAALSERPIDGRSLLTTGQVSREQWSEAVDRNCRIVVCEGEEDFGKPYALAKLHSEDLKTTNKKNQKDYDPDLCGKVSGKATPSPVWIADLGDYQVVTVFGAAQIPRSSFLESLESRQIFPLSSLKK
jgi:CRISPR-associated protein Cmr6